MDILLQQIINGLVLGSMYALVALGYTMVYGIINLINFAHGEVLMVGALTSWTLIGWMQEAMPGLPGWLILLVAMLISCVVAASLNFVIEKVAYRPLRNSPKLAPLITAIGMSILLQTLAMIIWKPNPKPYPTLLPNTPIDLAGAVITPTQIMILGLTAVSLAVLTWLVNHTRLGRAMRATAENPRVAGLMGVKPDMVISATFVIYLAVAAKSNAGYKAYNEARAFVKQDKSREVPVHLRNAPTKLMKELGYGHEYRYAHDEPNAYAAGETYLPDGMPEPNWYQPVPRGLEGKIGEKLALLKKWDEEAGRST